MRLIDAVIVPVRGMSCIPDISELVDKSKTGYRPREGYELHPLVSRSGKGRMMLSSP